MPKRIPNLSEIILDQASSLYSLHGYDAVDMKMVAAAAGTSVGNLYNYHSSKPALFLAVVGRWRRNLLTACQELLAAEMPRRQKILAVLGRLYDDASAWQGLWKEFLAGREERAHLVEHKSKSPGGAPWNLGPEEQVLMADFEKLLTGQPSADPQARWASLAITATLQLAGRYPEYREDNWKFIESLVDKL